MTEPHNKYILIIALIIVYLIFRLFLNVKKGTTREGRINRLLAELEAGMIEYMKCGESAYNESHIKECISVLESYLSTIVSVKSKNEAQLLVNNTVLKLNDLNQKCDFQLIETDQREQICEIIILAGHLEGHNSLDEDTTEEFREW